jgi:hypothetical protein
MFLRTTTRGLLDKVTLRWVNGPSTHARANTRRGLSDPTSATLNPQDPFRVICRIALGNNNCNLQSRLFPSREIPDDVFPAGFRSCESSELYFARKPNHDNMFRPSSLHPATFHRG